MNRLEIEFAVSDVPDILKIAARRMLITSSVDLTAMREAQGEAIEGGRSEEAAKIEQVLDFAANVATRARRAVNVLAGKEPSRMLTTEEQRGIFGSGIDHSDSLLPDLVGIAMKRLAVIEKTIAESKTSPPSIPVLWDYYQKLMSASREEADDLRLIVQRGLFAYAVMGDRA
jgi:hypothetical protein